MSGAIYWLQKQRKSELITLADRAGLKGSVADARPSPEHVAFADLFPLCCARSYEGFLKSELEVALEGYLRAHQVRLANDLTFEPFYRRIGALSPVKRESGGGGGGIGGGVVLTSGDEVKKPRARRQTRAREEIDQL